MAQANAPPSLSSLLHFEDLFNNPLFAGGLGLAGLGAGVALARKSVVQGAHLIKRRLLVDLEINHKDESYKWFLQWMAQHRNPPNAIIDRITRLHHLSIETSKVTHPNGSSQTHFSLQPGYGRHILRYKNAFISINREKQRTQDIAAGKPFETITLTTLYAHRHIFEDLFRDMHNMAMESVEGKTIMYITRGPNWEPFGEPRRKRPLDSIILDEGIKERIVADVKDFIGTHKWYIDRGIPYRRGYLLYGPPGSGKSSFIQSLAGELDYGVALVNLSERGLTDDKLIHLLTKVPPRTLLLLEDADAAFNRRRQTDSDGYQGQNVTFSGLLNALDGVASGEERIAFLTTNHIELLDEALIRPGRVDMTVRIGEATRYQASEMWDRFFGDIDTDHKGRERFLAKLQAFGLVSDAQGEFMGRQVRTSTAAIQGLFLYNKDDMEGAIEMVEGLMPKVYEPEPANGQNP
jgi:chaperone BCS1